MIARSGTIFAPPQTIQKAAQEEIKAENLAKHMPILFRIQTVFPFDLFPDLLTVDPLKINYTQRMFFLSEEVKSILIENIGHVIVTTGPFFATLSIVDTVFKSNSIEMKPVHKNDALKAQTLLQGLMVSLREHLDPTKIITEGGIKAIEALGSIT